LRSVFHSSSPLIIDHTPPIIVNLAVTVDVRKLNESGIVDVREDITATWDVMEETSDISYCTCALGNVDYHMDKSSFDLIENLSKMAKSVMYNVQCILIFFSGRLSILDDISETRAAKSTDNCKWTGLNLPHGTSIFVTVKCVNTVELATTVSSSPVYIVLYKPSSTKAVLDIEPISENSKHEYFTGIATTLNVQSNKSCVLFNWDGFEYMSPLAGYSFELHDSHNQSFTGWKDAGYRTMVTKCGLSLSHGQAAVASVKARNTGDFWSDTISDSVRISVNAQLPTGMALSEINTFTAIKPVRS